MREIMHLRNSLPVRVCGQSKMGETILRVTISTALNEDNLGPEFSHHVRDKFVKRPEERLIPCAREKRDVQLETLRFVSSDLVWEAGSREEVFSALVEVDV